MIEPLLRRLGLRETNGGACGDGWIEAPGGEEIASINPSTGKPIARVKMASAADYDRVVTDAQRAFASWRNVPAPRRGEVVRQIGMALREHKEDLGLLVTLEASKIASEGRGEVQEMIDMCDFAVGISRQLHGLTIASERPRHRMAETVAPDRPGRDHHGVQLPGRRLGVECRARGRLRRHDHLEALARDAADRRSRCRISSIKRGRSPKGCAGVFNLCQRRGGRTSARR